MVYLVVEGPDGLGKSALVELLHKEATKHFAVAEVVVPEPSKVFGKHPDPIAWGLDFLQTTKHRPGITILDRFPVPSELVYKKEYVLGERYIPEDVRKVLKQVSYHKLLYVLVRSTSYMPSAEFLRKRLQDDPMYKDIATPQTLWYTLQRRYDNWRSHTMNPTYNLWWQPETVWTELTAEEVLSWVVKTHRGWTQ